MKIYTVNCFKSKTNPQAGLTWQILNPENEIIYESDEHNAQEEAFRTARQRNEALYKQTLGENLQLLTDLQAELNNQTSNISPRLLKELNEQLQKLSANESLVHPNRKEYYPLIALSRSEVLYLLLDEDNHPSETAALQAFENYLPELSRKASASLRELCIETVRTLLAITGIKNKIQREIGLRYYILNASELENLGDPKNAETLDQDHDEYQSISSTQKAISLHYQKELIEESLFIVNNLGQILFSYWMEDQKIIYLQHEIPE